MAFPVVMYGCESLEYKEGRALKNRCFWAVVLEKILESPLDCKDIKPINHKENQSWIFIWRTDAEVVASILWAPDMMSWLIRKYPDVGSKRDTDLRDKVLDSVGEAEGGMIWENSIEACILPYVK